MSGPGHDGGCGAYPAWQPPSLFATRTTAELWNAVLSYAGRPLTLDDQGRSFAFTPAAIPPALSQAVMIEPHDGPRFAAIITSFPFKTLFGVDYSASELERLPPALRDCLYEGIVGTLWQAIPAERLGGFRIGDCQPLAAQPGLEKFQWLSIEVQGVVPEPVTALVGLLVEPFVKALGLGALAPLRIESGLKKSLTTDAFFVVGSFATTLQAFNRLAPGDVVVLPERAPDSVCLRIDRMLCGFRASEAGWVCTGWTAADTDQTLPDKSNGPSDMTDSGQDVQQAELRLEELTIVVEFDVGRLTLPLSEIETWRPGTTVALAPPTDDNGVAVTARANGRVIATGDLVRISDRMAVRLTRLHVSPAAQAGS